tara:strand:+ start:542 stop:1156 length:615 start_codon:yes stop_codon:yes gene_type:complete
MSERIDNILKKLRKDASSNGDDFYAANLDEVIKNVRKKPKKAIYAAAFIDEANEKVLYNWWKLYTKQDILKNRPKHPHMTIKFKPSKEDVLSLPIGETDKVRLTVTGVGFDENTQAVRVRVNDTSFEVANEIPHITISWSDDSRASNSNDLLKRNIVEVSGGLELEAKLGLFLSNGKVTYDLAGTIYGNDNLESDNQVSIEITE